MILKPAVPGKLISRYLYPSGAGHQAAVREASSRHAGFLRHRRREGHFREVRHSWKRSTRGRYATSRRPSAESE